MVNSTRCSYPTKMKCPPLISFFSSLLHLSQMAKPLTHLLEPKFQETPLFLPLHHYIFHVLFALPSKQNLNLSFLHLYCYQLSPSHHIVPVPHNHFLDTFLLHKIHFFLHIRQGNHFENANQNVSHLYLKNSSGFHCSHGTIPILSPGPAQFLLLHPIPLSPLFTLVFLPSLQHGSSSCGKICYLLCLEPKRMSSAQKQ